MRPLRQLALRSFDILNGQKCRDIYLLQKHIARIEQQVHVCIDFLVYVSSFSS